MKQVWIAVFFLAVLLLGGIVSCVGVRWVQEPIAQQLEQAAQAGFSENWELAEDLLEKAQTRWHAYRHALATISDHGPMEEIDSLFGELEFYRLAKDPTLFSGLCKRLSLLCRAISESLSISWWNLL